MMQDKKLFFIYNPNAGKAQIKNKLADIIDIFVKAGYEVTVYPTQNAGDAIGITKQCEDKYDLIVCSGGDGTLDEVVTGMMQREKKMTIGYVPTGSTNDFANSLHIPKKMITAAEVIVGGSTFACDIGKFNDDSFVYIAAFGIFTDVSYETKQPAKNVLGHMAYILEGMKRLSSIKAYHVKFIIQEGELFQENRVIEDDFIFGMITNSESVGGFKRITGNNVELDDGLFEVTLIKKPKNPIELNEIMAALLVKDIDSRSMYCFKTSHVIIEAEEQIAWTLDGEFGGNHQYVTIENEKKAIQIKVPDKK